jgi:hypothetical protein
MPLPLNISNPLQPQADAISQDTPPTEDRVEEASAPPEPNVAPKVKKRNDEFRQRIEVCKNYRRKLIANWTISIDYRRGKPFTSQTDDDQVAVNLDWAYTKAKQAALFSQVPQARLNHVPETLPKVLPWVPNFERMLNDNLVEGGIESTMDEVLPDAINAAGIGVGMVSYECITEDKQVPKFDVSRLPPQLQAEMMTKGTLGGQPIPMDTVPSPVDKRYLVQRVSPADLLWPLRFIGSNFNNGPWIGRTGRVTWAEGKQRFSLLEEDKSTVLGEDRPMMDKLTHDVEKDKSSADDMVEFDEIFYWDYAYDSEAKSFKTIHHLVFVSGKDDPVVDEPWKGQKLDEDGSVIGVTKFPIQVLAFDYITDEAIPPSDSAIARPQINEINKGRTQQIRQRERSLPVRWFDVNRVDPAIQQSLMRGTWQAMIPVQGEGSRIIGEVARASMPVENFQFDQVARFDLQQLYTIHPLPAGKDQEAADTDPNQNVSGFNNPIGRERAKVAKFFCSLAEILGGLMCLYEDEETFGEGFDPKFSKVLKFSILTDATVLLDAGQRLSRLNQFIKMYAKSGWVNIEPVLQEVAGLVGMDPSIVVKQPNPKPPVEPNISLRLTGVEDMLNPLTLAFLIKSGQAPSAELIEQAKSLIQQTVVPPVQPEGEGQPGAPGMPPQGGQPAQPPPGGAPPQGGQPGSSMPIHQEMPLRAPVAGPPPGTPTPNPAPPRVGEAHPQWTAMGDLEKRTDGAK